MLRNLKVVVEIFADQGAATGLQNRKAVPNWCDAGSNANWCDAAYTWSLIGKFFDIFKPDEHANHFTSCELTTQLEREPLLVSVGTQRNCHRSHFHVLRQCYIAGDPVRSIVGAAAKLDCIFPAPSGAKAVGNA